MRSILLYHIYPINHWQEITDILFQKLPFDRIIVHVSMPTNDEGLKHTLEAYFGKYKVDHFLYSLNSGIGEVDAMRKFVATEELHHFDMLTYMHCKGVTKQDNVHVMEWTKLMWYFIIEKMDECRKAFRKGFVTYGINKSIVKEENPGFIGSKFFYEGNFVSLNLRKVQLKEAVEQHLENSYYGLEGFWGKLCDYKDGYSPFNSGINHYLQSVSKKTYSNYFGRLKYNLIKNYYIAKSRFRLLKQAAK